MRPSAPPCSEALSDSPSSRSSQLPAGGAAWGMVRPALGEIDSMKAPGRAANEHERLSELRALEVLDTLPEAQFDGLVELASHIADSPIALVSLVDESRQWFKARTGLDIQETPRDVSFCGHVVADDRELIIHDTHEDPRFRDNPLVSGPPHIRFYAGLPLRMASGEIMGTLCVMDTSPRQLSDLQLRRLELLSAQAIDQLEARSRARALDKFQTFFELSPSLLCTATPDLFLADLNPAWVAALGHSFEELRSVPFTDLVHPDDLEATIAEAARLSDPGTRTVNFENRYRHEDGHWVPLSWSAAVQDGTFYATATDMTEHNRQQGRLGQILRASKHLASVVETSDDAILTETIHGIVTSWNASAQQIFGYPDDEIIGQHVSILFPVDRPHDESEVMHKLRTGARLKRFDTVRKAKDGRLVDVSISISPLYDDDGEVVGASKIIRDVTERNRLDRLKGEFVSTVSHELRTPLTSIRGSLGLVAGGATGELARETKEYVDIALANCDRLVRLTNDILDIEKMDSGNMDLELVPRPLSEVLASAIRANAGMASAHSVTIRLVGEIPAGDVLVDPDRIAQVFANLISNAIKYSPAEGTVELSAQRAGRGVRCCVRDYGPGVPAQFSGRIFQRFTQADGSSTRSKGGTGLGLAITKAIVERLGGKVGYGAANGGGSVFYFSLPRLLHWAEVEDIAGASRILVCEDDPNVATALSRLLTMHAYSVDVAPTVDRARRLVSLRRYDAITLDLMLADGVGAEVVAAVRRSDHPETPIVVVTGSSDLTPTLSFAVQGILTKPFDSSTLMDVISRTILGDSQVPH